MGIISLVFNRPSCGRFNNILFGHAENIQYSMNYRAKRNSPILGYKNNNQLAHGMQTTSIYLVPLVASVYRRRAAYYKDR